MGFEEKLHFFISNERLFPAYARSILNKTATMYFKARFIKQHTLVEEQTFQADIDHYAELYGLKDEMFNHKVEHLLNV